MSKIDMSWIPAGIWNEDMRARTPCCLLRSDNGPSKDDEPRQEKTKSDHRLTQLLLRPATRKHVMYQQTWKKLYCFDANSFNLPYLLCDLLITAMRILEHL